MSGFSVTGITAWGSGVGVEWGLELNVWLYQQERDFCIQFEAELNRRCTILKLNENLHFHY